MQNIYKIFQPAQALPVIFDSPHSGRHYPDDFQYACPFELLQKGEDNYVDDLFESVPHYGGTLLTALFPRTYIDVNRAADDIDTALLAEDWPGDINPTNRANAGIGLIRRLAKPGFPVYDGKLSVAALQHRIANYYNPYHETLQALTNEAHYNFGQVWHINCHSMPSFSKVPYSLQPDFVLGDRDGTSCALDFTHSLRDFLKGLGYRVAINDPYKGVELVRRHADPTRGRHSLQLEINKALYWNEEDNIKLRNYKALKEDIEKIISFVTHYAHSNLVDLAAD